MPSVNVKVIEPRTSQLTTPEGDSDKGGHLMRSPHRLLQIALAVFGAAFLLIYPLAIVWPSGWAWHAGIMAVQSMPAEHCGHLFGDVPALFLAAIVLGGLLVWSENGQAKPLRSSVTL